MIKIMIVNLTLIISIWPMVHCIQNTSKIKVGNVKVNGKALKSKEVCDTLKVEYINLLISIDLQNI